MEIFLAKDARYHHITRLVVAMDDFMQPSLSLANQERLYGLLAAKGRLGDYAVFPKLQRYFQLATVRNVRTGACAQFIVNEDPESRRDWITLLSAEIEAGTI